jgi:hypothetical protein
LVWSGDRLNAQLERVHMFDYPSGEVLLYESDKATLTAHLARAAILQDDRSQLTLARDLTLYSLRQAWNAGEPMPLGKVTGQLLARLPAAVAILSAAQRPMLRLEPQAQEWAVTWPLGVEGYWLEETTDLLHAPWEPRVTTEMMHRWTVAPAAANHFFRLHVITGAP